MHETSKTRGTVSSLQMILQKKDVDPTQIMHFFF